MDITTVVLAEAVAVYERKLNILGGVLDSYTFRGDPSADRATSVIGVAFVRFDLDSHEAHRFGGRLVCLDDGWTQLLEWPEHAFQLGPEIENGFYWFSTPVVFPHTGRYRLTIQTTDDNAAQTTFVVQDA